MMLPDLRMAGTDSGMLYWGGGGEWIRNAGVKMGLGVMMGNGTVWR